MKVGKKQERFSKIKDEDTNMGNYRPVPPLSVPVGSLFEAKINDSIIFM